MIPDGWIGRFLLDDPFNSPPNRLDDCETFVELKTLASLALTPNARARQVQADSEKRALERQPEARVGCLILVTWLFWFRLR
jgi:hypothetical protein